MPIKVTARNAGWTSQLQHSRATLYARVA